MYGSFVNIRNFQLPENSDSVEIQVFDLNGQIISHEKTRVPIL
tara:strand:+ start:294 stop:422 length:129 start_codon:yes stop_codon:yes gene_type:complete